MKPIITNSFTDACRAAYRASPMYRRLYGGGIPGAVGALLLRKPGEDREETVAQDGGSQPVDGRTASPAAPDATGLALGIERDVLGQEFMDEAQP